MFPSGGGRRSSDRSHHTSPPMRGESSALRYAVPRYPWEFGYLLAE